MDNLIAPNLAIQRVKSPEPIFTLYTGQDVTSEESDALAELIEELYELEIWARALVDPFLVEKFTEVLGHTNTVEWYSHISWDALVDDAHRHISTGATELAFMNHPNWTTATMQEKIVCAVMGHSLCGPTTLPGSLSHFLITNVKPTDHVDNHILRVADHLKIPVFNLSKGIDDVFDKLGGFIESNY